MRRHTWLSHKTEESTSYCLAVKKDGRLGEKRSSPATLEQTLPQNVFITCRFAIPLGEMFQLISLYVFKDVFSDFYITIFCVLLPPSSSLFSAALHIFIPKWLMYKWKYIRYFECFINIYSFFETCSFLTSHLNSFRSSAFYCLKRNSTWHVQVQKAKGLLLKIW